MNNKPLYISFCLLILSLNFFTENLLALESASGELKVEVLPNPAIVEPGKMMKLELQVTDLLGSLVEARAKWMVIPRNLGNITENGLFQAGAASGKGIIRVTVDAGKAKAVGHTLIRVEKEGVGRRIAVSLSPKEVVIPLGKSQQFQTQISTVEGRPLDGEVSWKVVPEGFGRITPEGLFLTGKRKGEGKLVARVRTKEGDGVGYARVRVSAVSESSKDAIALRPSFVLLKPGEVKKFELEVLNKTAFGVSATPKVTWKIEPEGIGEISEEGEFKAGKEQGRGVILVQVEAGDFVASAQSTISVGKGERLVLKILPNEIILAPGEMRQVEVSISRPDGSPVDAELHWDVIPERLGVLTQEGNFTAGFEVLTGQIAVYAETDMGEGLDIANILIRPRRFQVELDPPSILLLPNETKSLEARVMDEESNPVNVPVLLWSLEPPELGTIQEGIFQASSKPMSGRVRAAIPPEVGVGEGTMQVVISQTTKRRDRFLVEVKPDPPLLVRPYEEIQFTVEVENITNPNAPEEPDVIWSVNIPQLGSITQEGLFRAKMPPSGGEKPCKVIARVDPQMGVGKEETPVLITPIIKKREAYRLVLQPQNPRVKVNDDIHFTAYVSNIQGVQVDATYQWGVEGDIGYIDPTPDSETATFHAGPEPGVGIVYVIATPKDNPDIHLRASTIVTVVPD
jgi:hypothetical protein